LKTADEGKNWMPFGDHLRSTFTLRHRRICAIGNQTAKVSKFAKRLELTKGSNADDL
jgi:hypothetical protein